MTIYQLQRQAAFWTVAALAVNIGRGKNAQSGVDMAHFKRVKFLNMDNLCDFLYKCPLTSADA
jgi:hypothetical protein